MFELVGRVENSFRDYSHLLKYRRFLIKDQEMRSLELALDEEDEDYEEID